MSLLFFFSIALGIDAIVRGYYVGALCWSLMGLFSVIWCRYFDERYRNIHKGKLMTEDKNADLLTEARDALEQMILSFDAMLSSAQEGFDMTDEGLANNMNMAVEKAEAVLAKLDAAIKENNS